MAWNIFKKTGDWIKFWQKDQGPSGVGIKFVRDNNSEKYQAIAVDNSGRERLHSGLVDTISNCRRYVQLYMNKIDKDKMFESTLNEIQSQYEYYPSVDREELMFDFYLMSALPRPEDETLDFVLEENRKKLYIYLKKHMLDAVFFAICAEFRHVFDQLSEKSDALKKYFKKKDTYEFFQKYAVYYLAKNSSSAGEYLDRPELRNRHKEDQDKRRYSYQAAKQCGATDEEFVAMAQDAFLDLSWSGAYGGKPWAGICDGWEKLFSVSDKNIKELSIWIDHIYDLQHNTDTVFNKLKEYYKDGYGWIKHALDFKYNLKNLYQLFDKVSPDLKNFSAAVIKNSQGTTLEKWMRDQGDWKDQDNSEKPKGSSKKTEGKFKVGDKVKYINSKKPEYFNKIYTVSKVYKDAEKVWVEEDSNFTPVFDNLEHIENGEDAKRNEFKVGDVVELISNKFGADIGSKAEITQVKDKTRELVVKWLDKSTAHNQMNGTYDDKDFKLVSSEPGEFKVGDKVTVRNDDYKNEVGTITEIMKSGNFPYEVQLPSTKGTPTYWTKKDLYPAEETETTRDKPNKKEDYSMWKVGDTVTCIETDPIHLHSNNITSGKKYEILSIDLNFIGIKNDKGDRKAEVFKERFSKIDEEQEETKPTTTTEESKDFHSGDTVKATVNITNADGGQVFAGAKYTVSNETENLISLMHINGWWKKDSFIKSK